MGQRVVLVSDGYRVDGCGADGELVNRFLAHLGARAFSSATVRAYAYDLLNFLRFLAGRDARLADVVAMDLFDYLDWQQRPARTAGQPVVRLGAGRGAMPATMNRRIAAVRGLFEFAVMTGVRAENPVPAARRSTGLRPSRRGLLGHIGRAGRAAAGGWCASRSGSPRRWSRRTSRRSWRICGSSGTGRSRWRCCSAGCALRRSGRCG
jgi:hypothetical protein